MTSSTRIRFGALTAAAAVVAGGFFAAAPANAATGTITVAPETYDYSLGDWGDGFTVEGEGFTPGTTVTLDLIGPSGSLETFEVPEPASDPAGNFVAVFLPTVAFPAAGDLVSITATSTDGDISNTASIAQWIAPAGITTNVNTLTTSELTQKEAIKVIACGFTPGEDVTAEANYAGQVLDAGSYPVAANGCTAFSIWLAAGTAVTGDLVLTVAGASHTETTTITVTGPETNAGGGAPSVGNAAAPASTPNTPKRLPVVSG